MKYLQFTFKLSPSSTDFQDILCALLGEAGFDSFVTTEDESGTLTAYIKIDEYDPEQLQATLSTFPVPGISISYSYWFLYGVSEPDTFLS